MNDIVAPKSDPTTVRRVAVKKRIIIKKSANNVFVKHKTILKINVISHTSGYFLPIYFHPIIEHCLVLYVIDSIAFTRCPKINRLRLHIFHIFILHN